VVGARPQFIKAAPVSRALRTRFTEVLVHTGQHYDDAMSDVFFRELGLPAPDRNLGVGSGSHGAQTGRMMMELEPVILAERPDWVIVYGDTNSTLAGSVVAAKLHVPVAHVEAGLRSFDRRMPEEVNRVVSDHLSTLKFCPTETGVTNLAKEGIREGVHLVGDVMYDIFIEHLALARRRRPACLEDPIFKTGFALATIHRAENTDDRRRLGAILKGLADAGMPVLFPLHPRTQAALEAARLSIPKMVKAVEPVGYLDMIALEDRADVIVTDSGGVQKEAYFIGRPCVTVRETTEWPETVAARWNTLVGADAAQIAGALSSFRPSGNRPDCFGDGHAAQKILSVLADSASAGR
jgi:UDP-GlcNAc3NAcA epimerase